MDNSHTDPDHRSAFGVIPDFLAFGIGLGAAWYLGWRTPDLIWGLWVCSLTIGYATILSTIVSGAVVGWKAADTLDGSSGKRVGFLVVGAFGALFLLGFFTFHFGMFHLVHAIFLSLFFPLSFMPNHSGGGPDFIAKSMVPILFTLFSMYWPMLVATLISEREAVFGPLLKSLRYQPGGEEVPEEQEDQPEERSAHGAGWNQDGKARGMGKSFRNVFGGNGPDPFSRPYVNVIRMHLLIFFFAFSHAVKLDHFLIYAVVYGVYFFPWAAFFRSRKAASA